MLNFFVKVFRTSFFPSPMMCLLEVWIDDRDRSKILCSTVLTPVHDLTVKVRDLEFYIKVAC